MSVSLLNFGMLLGMLGLAVPVVVHLLNRRRFDVVHWGAMQFLQLGERTRQRIKLSDLLLLFLRLGLVALLVFLFTRPLVSGGPWIRSLHPEPVDVVIVIDGSYSMGWAGETITPHARAIQVCHELLDDLTGVDRVAIIDARQQSLLLTPAPVTDLSTARLELEKILPPDGSADLAAAVKMACQLLNQSFSLRREVVVLTDKQQASWKLDSSSLWNETLALRKSAAVPIQFSAIDVGSPLMEDQENFIVGTLQPARELVVTDVPVTVTTRVKYVGLAEEARCELYWAVDGQQLSRETDLLTLRAGEEAVAQFSTRFSDAGSHIITASVKPDALPGDDLSQCVVQVLEEIPVMIAVHELPDPQSPLTPQTIVPPATDHFLRLAFGNPDHGKVWVRSQKLAFSDLTAERLQTCRFLFLTGAVPENFDWRPLTAFLQQGGTIAVLPEGNSVAADLQRYHSWQIDEQPLLPALFQQLRHPNSPAKLERTSLSGPWLERFGSGRENDLLDLLGEQFWELSPTTEKIAAASARNRLAPPTIDARWESGEPVFVRRAVGAGQLLVSSVSFDGQGNDLVRLRSFVPFVHELVFGLTASSSRRNTELGQPLVVRQLSCQPLTIPVTGPAGITLTAQRSGSSEQIQWLLAPPRLSGIYEFQTGCPISRQKMLQQEAVIPFAVQAARGESNLKRLSAEEIDLLANTYDLRWQPNSGKLLTELASKSGGMEIWPLLLFLLIGFLILELVLTRKLVQGGHVQPIAPVEQQLSA